MNKTLLVVSAVAFFVFLSFVSAEADTPFQLTGARGDFPNTTIEFPEDALDECSSASNLRPQQLEVDKDFEPSEKNVQFGMQGITRDKKEAQYECDSEISPCKYVDDSADNPPSGIGKGHQTPFDNCIFRGSGPICNKPESPKKCCEVEGEGSTVCECEGEFSSLCDNSADCARQLCVAEAGSEPEQCVYQMLCVAKGDADQANGDFCKAVTAYSGDAWRYSAARCVCDRWGDGSGWRFVTVMVDHDNNPNTPRVKREEMRWIKAYGQNYCLGCDSVNKGTGHPDPAANEKCSKAYDRVMSRDGCKEVRFTHYAVGGCPCDKERRVGESESCGDHVFCECR